MIDNNLLTQLSEVYSKTNLEKGILQFVKYFYIKHYSRINENPALESVYIKLVTKKQLTKIELSKVCFSVFENETIYKEFLVTLPLKLQTLIEKLLWVESMSDSEAEIIVKEPITQSSNSYYISEKELQKPYYFFSVSKDMIYTYPRTAVFSLSLHPLFKQVLMEFYPKPVHYYFNPVKKLPETQYRFSAENLILEEMPRLLSYYMQEAIKYSTKGRPSDATLNKLQKTTGITEFFPAENELFSKMRSMLLAGMLYNFKVSNISMDTISVLKELFTKRYLLLYSSQFMLTQLKGWGNLTDYDYHDHTQQNFLRVLKQLPGDTWISSDNLIGFIQSRVIQIKPINSYALNNRLYFEKELQQTYGNYKEKKYAGFNENMIANYPFIKGSVFLFASFGLLEIAYKDVNTKEFSKTFFSGYDGLQYFRLTALGAYVLGLSTSYEPAQALQQNKLRFSEDGLMILAEGDMGVLDIMLSNYAEKAGVNRFKVTPNHFLKDCRSRKDVDLKIQLFKKTIAAKLPVYWEHQFMTWQLNALKVVVDKTIQVFKIPPDAKELQRLIAQDAELKVLILKAEQFHMLVASNHVGAFKNKMKELGYLVE